MKLQVQSIHFDADQKLLDFIQRKADKLETFHDNIIDGEVYLKLDKDNSDQNKVVEMKVQVPGKTLFAKEQCKSFEEGADSAVDSLRRQIKKHKEKLRAV
ncbi:MAG: putative sigma-54 modulation protein [Sphingobacteriales bacterium]|jgi:putative sigma-54 modulation protein